MISLNKEQIANLRKIAGVPLMEHELCVRFGEAMDSYSVFDTDSSKVATAMSNGEYDEQLFKRTGQKCYCNNYTSYQSTLKPGVAYAMLMNPLSCTKCYSAQTQLKFKLLGVNLGKVEISPSGVINE